MRAEAVSATRTEARVERDCFAEFTLALAEAETRGARNDKLMRPAHLQSWHGRERKQPGA